MCMLLTYAYTYVGGWVGGCGLKVALVNMCAAGTTLAQWRIQHLYDAPPLLITLAPIQPIPFPSPP
jgi:hypothetical protein